MFNKELFKEYLEVLYNDPLSLPIWWYLNYKFMMPAAMIARNDRMEEFMKHFSLNGIKIPTICKP